MSDAQTESSVDAAMLRRALALGNVPTVLMRPQSPPSGRPAADFERRLFEDELPHTATGTPHSTASRRQDSGRPATHPQMRSRS